MKVFVEVSSTGSREHLVNWSFCVFAPARPYFPDYVSRERLIQECHRIRIGRFAHDFHFRVVRVFWWDECGRDGARVVVDPVGVYDCRWQNDNHAGHDVAEIKSPSSKESNIASHLSHSA